jgi:hypothetical protein
MPGITVIGSVPGNGAVMVEVVRIGAVTPSVVVTDPELTPTSETKTPFTVMIGGSPEPVPWS